jgi:hypothetical protein
MTIDRPGIIKLRLGGTHLDKLDRVSNSECKCFELGCFFFSELESE